MKESLIRLDAKTGDQNGIIYNHLLFNPDFKLGPEYVISSRIELSIEDCGKPIVAGVKEFSLGAAAGRIGRIANSITAVASIEIESRNIADFLRLRQALLAYVGGQTIALSAGNTDHLCSFVNGLKNDLRRLKNYVYDRVKAAGQKIGLRLATIGYDAGSM